MKKCSLCKTMLDLDQFRLRWRNGKYSPRSQCKPCESKQQVIRNRRKLKEDEDYRKESLDRISNWGEKNHERRLEAERARKTVKYREDFEYRSSVLHQAASYRSRKRNAQPPWLTQESLDEIKNIYRVSAKVTKATGKPHDVDHIIPLRGKNICGLHVPWNLRVLPASMNRSKGNAFSD